MDWQEHHSNTTSFLMAELELVIITGLDMFPFYDRIAKKVS